MKKVMLIAAMLLCVACLSSAQEHMQVDKTVQQFQTFYNAKQNDSLFGIMSARIRQLMPLDKVAGAMGQLHSQVGNLNTYTFSKQEGKMNYYKVAFTNATLILIASIDADDKLDVFRFVPEAKEEAKEQQVGATSVSLSIPTGTLHGTLTVPNVKTKVPVVLLIAGSGPTDRDGNSNMGLLTNAYRMLADSLRNAGIACLRYDKRGIGESAGAMTSEDKMRFDDGVADAVAFINMLNKDTRFSGVTVVGHSEGSLVGMLAAQKTAVRKYVSVAGAGEPIGKIVAWQLSASSADMGKRATVIIDSLDKGYDVKNIDEDLFAIFKPSIQPFMRSWMKYDPAREVGKLKIPVLVLQGETDMQVTMKQAELLKKGLPSARLITFKSMNHVLKTASGDRAANSATYHDGSLPLYPGFASALISFIKK